MTSSPRRLFDPAHPISFFGWERSLARMLGCLARAVTTSLYSRQAQYITVKRLDVPDATPASHGAAPDRETECLVVDSLEAFHAVAAEIPSAFRDSVDELERRVAQGCVVCLARRPRSDGAGKEVVGYEIAERGVFSALGRRRKDLPAEVVFSHYAEVLPACRGQRIHRLLFATRDSYFRQRGGTIVCGVVAPQNRASLQALGRAGHTIVGTVKRISFFRVLVVWDRPLDRIENALRGIDGTGRDGYSAEAPPESDRSGGGHEAFRIAEAFGGDHQVLTYVMSKSSRVHIGDGSPASRAGFGGAGGVEPRLRARLYDR